MIIETVTLIVTYLGTIFTVSDLVIIAGLVDVVLGWLPDKYTKYKGVIVKTFYNMYLNGKD